MNDKEFNSYEEQTRLSKNSHEAARLLLAEGISHLDVAAEIRSAFADNDKLSGILASGTSILKSITINTI